jgi:Phosphotransferase enzyme family
MDVLEVSRCELTEQVTNRSSTVWRVATERGGFWLKHNAPVHRAEGRIQALLAELAPGYVDAPLATDARQGWILSADGGTTLIETSPETRGIEVETLCRMLQDYGHLQRLTASSGDRLRRVGMETLDPVDTAQQVRDEADWMANAARGDPRRISQEDHQRVLGAMPALEEAGEALAAGPVPLLVDHGDLWPGNVFIPREDGRYRVFDLADAAWTHPFCSLVMLLHECLYRWRLPKGEHVLDLRDPRIRTIFDSYFECWTDLASLASLRTLGQYALRIAALHQSRAWSRELQLADPHTLATQGQQPWHWLQDVTKEVLL